MQEQLDTMTTAERLWETLSIRGEGIVEDVMLERRAREAEKDSRGSELRGEALVDLREWPLPPSRTEWVMVQGERKRKRQT